MAGKGFEDLQVYRLAERLADKIWAVVRCWDHFAKDTVGKQMVRAADSIGANLAEGTGRGSFQDNRRFIRIARGSLYETRHWLRRSYQRSLLTSEQVSGLKPLIDELGPRLNAYLRSIGKRVALDDKACLTPARGATRDKKQGTRDKGPHHEKETLHR